MGWTNEQVKELKKLWKKGLSTGEIGRALGISKNAVVGKAHRLDLAGRPSPIRTKAHKKKVTAQRTTKKTPKKVIKTPTKNKTPAKKKKAAPVVVPKKSTPKKGEKAKTKSKAKVILTAAQKKAKVAQSIQKFKNFKQAKAAKTKVRKVVKLVDLKATSCRWPIGDPKDADFHFCGKEAIVGKSYCAEHCAQAFSGVFKSK